MRRWLGRTAKRSFLLLLGNLPLPRNGDSSLQALRDGAALLMHLYGSLSLHPLPLRHLHPIRDTNARDQWPTIHLFDVPLDKAGQLIRVARDPARLQRARQGPGESPA